MNNFDFDTEISIFPSQISRKDAITETVYFALDLIKSCDLQEDIDELRAGNDEIKRKNLPTVSFHGKFDGSRRKENFNSSTGIIIVDIDDVEGDLEEVKYNIMANIDSCLACFVSPSGNGIKCLYLVDSDIVTVDTYRNIGKQVAKKFSKYGKTDTLSITDCLILSADKNLIINDSPIVDTMIKIDRVSDNKKDAKLAKLDTSKELFDEAEDFFELVLYEQIESRADNNFHFIQMSVFELAKFGFKHPEHDLSFVIDLSEGVFKKSSDNKTRFTESVTEAKFVKQTSWPYNLFGDEPAGLGSEYSYDEDDREPNEDQEEEDPTFGLIDYKNFRERVYNVIDEGDRVGDEISLPNFADIFRFKSGLLTMTGIPSHGKTEFIDQIMVDLSRLHGWKHTVAGFEQREEEHIIKLVRRVLGFNVTSKNANKTELDNALDFVIDHIKHTDVSRTGGDIKKILKVFEKSIEIFGTKCFVLDPFNLLTIKTRATGHEKVNEILQTLVHFGKKHDVLIILVAHPYKMTKDEKTGKYVMPDFYSVKGSSAFFEMSYHGLVVYRDDDLLATVRVKVLKVKQNNLGNTGKEVFFNYHKSSGRYIPTDEEGNIIECDCFEENWHKKALKHLENKDV